MEKKANMEKASKRLRELRGIRTRTGVASELCIAYSTLQSYEDGKRTPAGNVMQKIADYYGVTVESIFFDE